MVIKNRCILFYLVYIDACKQIANTKPQLEGQNTRGEKRGIQKDQMRTVSVLENLKEHNMLNNGDEMVCSLSILNHKTPYN